MTKLERLKIHTERQHANISKVAVPVVQPRNSERRNILLHSLFCYQRIQCENINENSFIEIAFS